jgi:hypothetical protein
MLALDMNGTQPQLCVLNGPDSSETVIRSQAYSAETCVPRDESATPRDVVDPWQVEVAQALDPGVGEKHL